MAKYPTKCLDNQSNQISSIYCHIKSKHSKNPLQKSAQKKEPTKGNAIMDKLDDLDGNI